MIDSVWIKSFRCLSEISFSFSKGPFLSIISQNNVGKTSVLEACYVLSHLSSFVTSDLSQIVPFDLEASYMGIKLVHPKKDFNYYLKVDNQGKKYINLNERPVRKKSDIQSLFRSIYISSDSLVLVTSNPSFRRNYLDLGISQSSMSYRRNLSTYHRLIQHKNRLLKHGGDKRMLYQMNAQLVPLIREIQRHRVTVLQEIERLVQQFIESVHLFREKVSIDYISNSFNYSDDDALLNALNENLTKELLIKCSNLGPHRDDYQFRIGGRDLKSYFSRGICRTVAFFFQISQASLIKDLTGMPMLLLLDEPFSEIHHTLKNKLIPLIPSSFYVIYTSTQINETAFLNKDQMYAINNGRLCKI